MGIQKGDVISVGIERQIMDLCGNGNALYLY